MSRPRIVEQNYHEFLVELRAAVNAGNRIEPTDKERWQAWVRENKIQEAAFRSVAARKYEGVSPVILDSDGPWRGYYLYTTSEEACLKWVRD
jgi:hypothetical protein